MSVCPVACWGNPILAIPAQPVEHFGKPLEALARDLRETAEQAGALYMCAPQIGCGVQLIYIAREVAGEPLLIANPVVEEQSRLLQHHVEACASLPGVQIDMQRAASLTVGGRSLTGGDMTVVADGIFAQALGHELAHVLAGRTILDGVTRRKWFFVEKLRKFKGKHLDYRNSQFNV